MSLAVLNETVWRNTSTATWVAFKVWGIMSLIFLFALAQTPFLLKHHVDPETLNGDQPPFADDPVRPAAIDMQRA